MKGVKNGRRKIIEIYVTENKEDNIISFEINRCEDSDVANAMMKKLLYEFTLNKNDEDELEVDVD